MYDNVGERKRVVQTTCMLPGTDVKPGSVVSLAGRPRGETTSTSGAHSPGPRGNSALSVPETTRCLRRGVSQRLTNGSFRRTLPTCSLRRDSPFSRAMEHVV